MNGTLLVVDDDPGVLSALRRALMEEPYGIIACDGGEAGLKALREPGNDIRVILSDEMMPGMSGNEFLAIAREERPETIRMLLTGHASVENIMAAVNRGEIFRFFVKPWDDMELRLSIGTAFDKHALESENRRLLRTVRRQAAELKVLEESHPGIATMQRDAQGRLIVQEVSEEEIAEILLRCEREDD